MPSALSDSDRLRRVFELELEKDCADGVVMGGLDRMIIQMIEDGALPKGHPLRSQVDALPAGGYRALPPDRRTDLITTRSSDFVQGVEEPLSDLKEADLDQWLTLWAAYLSTEYQVFPEWTLFAGAGA